MAMTPEGRVKDAVKKLLGLKKPKKGPPPKPIGYFFMPVQNGMGRVGIPDFIGCVPVTITPDMVGQTVGLFVGLEAKAPGKCDQTTANQEREIESIRAASGVAVVVDDVQQVQAELQKLGVYAYATPQQRTCPSVKNFIKRKHRGSHLQVSNNSDGLCRKVQ